MQRSTLSGHRAILLSVALITLVIGIFSFAIPPAIGSDASWGLQVMHNMERGGGFNLLIEPAKANVALNDARFLSWWSPGQYLVPYFYKLLLGVNDGKALALTITCCHLLGFAGFYKFFKKAGFAAETAALSVALILCHQIFIVPYAEYNGGEVILFGFVGWFLYGCLAIKDNGPVQVLFILFSGLIGFTCKSSFMWMYLAGICFMWIRSSSAAQKSLWVWIKNGIWIGVPAFSAVFAIYWFFLSRGDNPSFAAKGWLSLASAIKLSWMIILLPASSPVFTNLSIDEYMHGLSGHHRFVAFSILLGCTALSVYLIYQILVTIRKREYSLLILTFYTICIVFFSLSFFRQSAISFEGRHVRLMGLIVLPAIVHLIQQARAAFKWPMIAVCIVLISLNGYFLLSNFLINKTIYPQGSIGITQPALDRPTIKVLDSLDKLNSHNIIVIPIHYYSCTRGLEIRNSRHIDLNDGTYKGHAGNIYILLRSDHLKADQRMAERSFPGYRGFKLQTISDRFSIYSAR